ncbi:MAG: hypothetical protein CMN78_05295 [Spirochaetales bacterium]|nr:hypothetical protein [Spirochaetales bacterium]
MTPLGIGLVGIAGYGESHLEAIERCEREGTAKLQAVAIRPGDSEPDRETVLRCNGVRIHRAVDEMLQLEKNSVQLICLPTGIPSHAELSIAALNAGYHVLCEKPAAGCYDDAVLMRAVSRDTGKFLAIGYQHIYSDAVQNLKKFALERELGRLLKTKALVLWPRDSAYYSRNHWAGRLVADEKKVFDSPAQNAAAHYLNVMLYIAGASPAASANPVEIYGENYRGQSIESADTQFLRVATDTGVDIFYTATHATSEHYGPEIHYVFENGVVEFSVASRADKYRVRTRAGINEDPRFPHSTSDRHRLGTFHSVVGAIQAGHQPLCTIENAIQHSRCIQTLFEESCPTRPVDSSFLKQIAIENAINTVIEGVEVICRKTFEKSCGFAEAGAPWASQGNAVAVNLC